MAAKERKALGTGLNVLFGDDTESEFEEKGSVQTVPISKVEPRLEQPREYFDEEALETLADSISQYGLIQPIVVRKLDSGYYQIIAGERRWRASRLAGLTEVPVRIIEADDRLTAELALVENLQREDLNPIEEAKGYQTLMEDYKLTQDEVSKSVGKSRPAVANSLRLLNLCPEVLALVEKGDLSAGHARAVLGLADAKAQLSAAKQILEGGLSVRKAESLVAKLAKAKAEPERAEKTELVDYAKEVAAELSRALGRKVTLSEGRRLGKIELEFYGADDREALITQLKSIKIADK